MTINRKFIFHDGKAGVALTIRVTTRASKNELQEVQDDGTLKIRIKAAPVEGKANQQLTEFLSDLLNVPKSSIEIISGLSARNKLVTITGITSRQVQARLASYLKK